MNTLALLLLAAGTSSRMGGGDKLLELIDGKPLLSVMVARALNSGLPVYVTLPDPDCARAQLVANTAAQPVFVVDAAHGMATSLRAGIAALPETCTGAMIVPADMPDLQTTDFKHLSEVFTKDKSAPILRATSQDGTMGHPVILPRRFFEAVKSLTGDRGASPLLRANADQIRTVPLAQNRALTDLDTPQDWAEWRARNTTP